MSNSSCIYLIFTKQDKMYEYRFHDHFIPVIHMVFHVHVDSNCDEPAFELIYPPGLISEELKCIQKGQSLMLDDFSSCFGFLLLFWFRVGWGFF